MTKRWWVQSLQGAGPFPSLFLFLVIFIYFSQHCVLKHVPPETLVLIFTLKSLRCAACGEPSLVFSEPAKKCHSPFCSSRRCRRVPSTRNFSPIRGPFKEIFQLENKFESILWLLVKIIFFSVLLFIVALKLHSSFA